MLEDHEKLKENLAAIGGELSEKSRYGKTIVAAPHFPHCIVKGRYHMRSRRGDYGRGMNGIGMIGRGMGMDWTFYEEEMEEGPRVAQHISVRKDLHEAGSVGIVVAELNLEAVTRVASGRVCAGGNFLSSRVGD
ncbi:hypothetical protein F0562_007256 [Nyssa sinensis]|uniref:Uncharacterized protein n=1 Tax=Nyssa sinensis TaxID=561372 RepID=A0A5J5A7I5_9ASTE|nr:hypothetical protein F0562_007256 [Nyssa sinensis]